MSNTGLFLDMDSTLIRTKSGKTFPKDIDDWEFIPETVDYLKNHLKDYTYRNDVNIFVVSNQGGIKHGYFTTKQIDKKFFAIRKALMEELGITNMPLFLYSTGFDDFMRKPNPGMAYRLANACRIDLYLSVMIGDAGGRKGDFSDSDKVFAQRCNMDFIHVQDIIDGKIK